MLIYDKFNLSYMKMLNLMKSFEAVKYFMKIFVIIFSSIFISGCTYTSEDKFNLVCNGTKEYFFDYKKIDEEKNYSSEYMFIHLISYSFLHGKNVFSKDEKWDLIKDGVKITNFINGEFYSKEKSNDITNMSSDDAYIEYNHFLDKLNSYFYLKINKKFNRVTGAWREESDSESEYQSMKNEEKISHRSDLVVGTCVKVISKF